MPDTAIILPDGSRVRVRLPHGSDRPALRALYARVGVALDELELARALRFDPRRRAVACLTGWHDGAERLLGYGAADLGAGELDVLVVDPACAPAAAGLLADTLRTRAARARAAA